MLVSLGLFFRKKHGKKYPMVRRILKYIDIIGTRDSLNIQNIVIPIQDREKG